MTNQMNATCTKTTAADFAEAAFPCSKMNATMILDATIVASIFVALITLLVLVINLINVINLISLITLITLLVILRIPLRLKR